MKTLPQTPELLAVAQRVVWFKPSTETLADPVHFLAHVMTYGTPEDLRAMEGIVTIADYREALRSAPPGVIDARSWAYWNLVCGCDPPLPMPRREGIW